MPPEPSDKPRMKSKAKMAPKLRAHHQRARERQAAMEGSAQDSARLMVDPSFLFSEDAISWLADDQGARDGIVIPATFAEWLNGDWRNNDVALFVAPEDQGEYWARLDRLKGLLAGVAVFGHENVGLSAQAEEVRVALLERGDTAARIFADEWTFLESNSWAISKLHHPLDAFRDGGAVVVQFGRKLRDRAIDGVAPQGPAPRVLTKKLVAKASAKWVFVGGATVAEPS